MRTVKVKSMKGAGVDRVLAHLDADELVAFAQALIRTPSVVRAGDARATEQAVAEIVARRLGAAGLAVTLQVVGPHRPNVIGLWTGAGPGPCLMFEGHTDVVTPGDPAEWSDDPFSGRLRDGRIYGRGAADMKGGLAAGIMATLAVARAGIALPGRILVGALVDEETDMLGVKRFLRSRFARQVDAAIICEPQQNEVCLEQKGVAWVKVVVRGRMAHGSMPEAGANPVAGLAWIAEAARGLEVGYRRLVGRSRLLGHASVTPTIIRSPVAGEPQRNVIPSAAEMTLDVRLIPGLTPARVLRDLRGLCARLGRMRAGLRARLELLEAPRPPTRLERRARVARAVARAYRQVTGRAPVYGGVPGTTDGTLLMAQGGIPCVVFGPGGRTIPHRVDEYVEVKALVEAARVYAAAAVHFLRGT
jgi:succinyl-diaminopimelate desuccinylase